MTSPLRTAVKYQLSRDYVTDVNRLNKSIAGRNTSDAGLSNYMPPLPFSGDPEDAITGESLLMVCINPFFAGNDSKRVEIEYDPLKQLLLDVNKGDSIALDALFEQRANYFGSQFEHPQFFKRIENLMRDSWFKDAPNDRLFGKMIVATDILPYWSHDVDCIDSKILGLEFENDMALKAHSKVLSALVETINPRWIHLNGKAAREVFELAFCGGPLEVHRESQKRFPIRMGFTDIEGKSVPVLAHNLVPGQAGPQRKDRWQHMADIWQQWLESQ